jgi:hypothetical protein
MIPVQAASAFSALGHAEQPAAALSDEDRKRLAEIHELINLLAAELRELSADAAGSSLFPPRPVPPVVPYSYSYYQVPQAMGAFRF